MAWSPFDAAYEGGISPERRALIQAVTANPGMKPKEIAEHLGKNPNTTRVMIRKLLQTGDLTIHHGRYYPAKS